MNYTQYSYGSYLIAVHRDLPALEDCEKVAKWLDTMRKSGWKFVWAMNAHFVFEAIKTKDEEVDDCPDCGEMIYSPVMTENTIIDCRKCGKSCCQCCIMWRDDEHLCQECYGKGEPNGIREPELPN